MRTCVGAPLLHLEHRLHVLEPRGAQVRGGVVRGHDAKAQGLQVLGDGHRRLLVLVHHGDEDIARLGQALARRDGRLGVRLAKGHVDAHHLCRGAGEGVWWVGRWELVG